MQALQHYADTPGPYQQQASELHHALRWALLRNLVEQYNSERAAQQLLILMLLSFSMLPLLLQQQQPSVLRPFFTNVSGPCLNSP